MRAEIRRLEISAAAVAVNKTTLEFTAAVFLPRRLSDSFVYRGARATLITSSGLFPLVNRVSYTTLCVCGGEKRVIFIRLRLDENNALENTRIYALFAQLQCGTSSLETLDVFQKCLSRCSPVGASYGLAICESSPLKGCSYTESFRAFDPTSASFEKYSSRSIDYDTPAVRVSINTSGQASKPIMLIFILLSSPR